MLRLVETLILALLIACMIWAMWVVVPAVLMELMR